MKQLYEIVPAGVGEEASSDINEEMFAGYSDLLSVEDLHQITGVSKQVIREQINTGVLPGCRIGRRLFVSKARFCDYVMGGVIDA